MENEKAILLEQGGSGKAPRGRREGKTAVTLKMGSDLTVSGWEEGGEWQ